MNLPRLWRTIGPLRFSQLIWRVYYRFKRPREATPAAALRYDRRFNAACAVFRTGQLAPAPDRPKLFLPHSADSTPATRLAELRAGTLTFLHHKAPFAGGVDWGLGRNHLENRLWFHTLHYHRWLAELAEGYATTGEMSYREYFERLLDDWIAFCHPGMPGFSDFAWNSFAIAGRLTAWTVLYDQLGPAYWQSQPERQVRFLASYKLQADYLYDHIEWDLRANHLFRDIVGLAVAGRFLSGETAARWMAFANELAPCQIAEQVLPDGMHFERSPMYHLHVMEDILLLGQTLTEPDSREYIRKTWSKMAGLLPWLSHPDQNIALLQDGGFNMVAHPQAMVAAGAAAGLTPESLPVQGGRLLENSGLALFHGRRWTVFQDVGDVGPAIQPGHAHAGTLSFECSLNGIRMIVDPGTFGYDSGQVRQTDRATGAHNTVTIDEENSSEVWDIFRVGRRARILNRTAHITLQTLRVQAAHTGYRHLPGRPVPQRFLQVDDAGGLQIEDTILGTGFHRLRGGFLLAPGWNVDDQPNGWRLTAATGNCAVCIQVLGPEGLQRLRQPAVYHPEYGREIATQRLVWQIDGLLPCTIKTEITAT